MGNAENMQLNKQAWAALIEGHEVRLPDGEHSVSRSEPFVEQMIEDFAHNMTMTSRFLQAAE